MKQLTQCSRAAQITEHRSFVSDYRTNSKESSLERKSSKVTPLPACQLNEIIRVPTELSLTPLKDTSRVTERSKLMTKSQKQFEQAKAITIKQKFSFDDTQLQQIETLLIKGENVLKKEVDYAASIPEYKRVIVSRKD